MEKLFILLGLISLSNCHLENRLYDDLKHSIDTNGLLSIHTNDLDETFVYDNKVTIIHRAIINGSIKSYIRDYYLERSNEKIVFGIPVEVKLDKYFVEKVLLFTKTLVSDYYICSIKSVRYFKIYTSDYQIHDLCKLLDGVILIRKEKNYFLFYYKEKLVKYSIKNYDTEVEESNVFKNINTNFKYMKYISTYILEFIYSDYTIEYNMNNMKVLQVSQIYNPNNTIKKDNKSYVFIAAVSISSLISLLIIIILIVYKTLNKKYSYSPVIAKELENNIAEMVEIPMVGEEIPVYDNPKKDGKIYIKPDINDLHG